jgi:zinc D-Ala-D-Ala carboxypeptidase
MKSKKEMGRLAGCALLVAIIGVGAAAGILLMSGERIFGWNEDKIEAEETAKQKNRQKAADMGLLLLVNKQHPLDKEYMPEDLTAMSYYAPDRTEAGRYMREEAAAAFSAMVQQAALDGMEIKMTTAYRSYGFQKILFDNYVKQYGEENASRFSAKPGESEHQTGLAVDVSSPGVDFQLTDEFGETDEGKWVASHAHAFGFILRYPKGKEDITGYMHEPWHLRYVGKFVSNEIYEEQTTLEEYLKKYELN